MRSLAALMTVALFPICCSAEDRSDPPAKSPVSLQSAIDAVLKKVTPSIASIWRRDEATGEVVGHFSGVVVSKDGLIVTAAHCVKKVGDAVEIRLPGKKAATGKVRAKHKTYDLALIQIDGKEEWPAIEIGSSGTLTNCDPLLAVGFPGTGLYQPKRGSDAPCYVRLGYRREPHNLRENKDLSTTILSATGDSGGPLFDLTGAFVGICSGGDTRYVPADTLVQVWNDLAGDRPVPPRSSTARPAVESLAAATERGVRRVQQSVVEIRCDQRRWSGVAVYVGDGFLVTKASELVLGSKLWFQRRDNVVTVVLRDNLVTGATVVATDPARDLALLKLGRPESAGGIAPINWADTNDLPRGAILSAVVPPAFTPLRGVVSVPARKISPIPGCLPVMTKDAKGGVEITGLFDNPLMLSPWLGVPPFPLRQGDVITHLDGIPVRDRKGFNKLNFDDPSIGRHPRVGGELITVTYLRQGKTEQAAVNLRNARTADTQLIHPSSFRYSGFPTALASDLGARPEHCGAPIIDGEGRVVGLLIARAMFIESLILPASEVKAAIDAMRKSATITPDRKKSISG